LLNSNLHNLIVFNGQSFHPFALQYGNYHPEGYSIKKLFMLQYLCRYV
jgi:hypothetical protein